MRPNLPPDRSRVLRFGVVGLLNTALGYAVILSGLSLGWGDIVSNATGYAAGLIVGFALNRSWTFRRAGDLRQIYRYALTFLVCYGVNLAVVTLALSSGVVESPLAHLAGISIYSVLFYILSARYVFVDRSRDAPSIHSHVADP